MKTLIVSGACALALVLASACSTTPSYQTTRTIDSNALRANVKTALWQDPAISPFDVGVDVSRSRVHLTGFVDTPEQKRRAGQIALAVPNVTSVDNSLQVRPVVAVGMPPGAQVGLSADDPAIL